MSWQWHYKRAAVSPDACLSSEAGGLVLVSSFFAFYVARTNCLIRRVATCDVRWAVREDGINVVIVVLAKIWPESFIISQLLVCRHPKTVNNKTGKKKDKSITSLRVTHGKKGINHIFIQPPANWDQNTDPRLNGWCRPACARCVRLPVGDSGPRERQQPNLCHIWKLSRIHDPIMHD